MALRMVEIFLPAPKDDTGQAQQQNLEKLIEDLEAIGIWQQKLNDDRTKLRVLIRTEATEALLDTVDKHFAWRKDYRVVLLPVEATEPRIEEKPDESEPKKNLKIGRVAVEEIRQDLVEGSKVNWLFLVTVILSTIVAAVGLIKDSVAVIIGAMVIAPLLTPNMALALATTLGDLKLARRVLWTNIVGVVVAFTLALGIGTLIPIEQNDQIMLRTGVSYADLILGLAAGAAGALAFTTGVPPGLVGVMVAVALLPPVVVCGLEIGAGHMNEALGALMLLAANVICVNLAGVVIFYLKGIRPRAWWEADKARRALGIVVVIWTMALIVLMSLIYLSQEHLQKQEGKAAPKTSQPSQAG